MKVHPRNLLPGSLILSDVMGNTTYPIVPKNTVVEDIHIEVLTKFRVPYVEVASKLADGSHYVNETHVEKEDTQPEIEQNEEEKLLIKNTSYVKKESWTFYDYYVDAVQSTIELFENWNEHSKLDITSIREMILPLVEIGEETSDILIQLHHYTDKHYYFFHHIVALPVISSYLANKLNYSKNERVQIALAAYLSDIGMLLVDKKLYYKDGILTEEEFEEVKKHPVLSYRLIEHEKYLSKNIKLAVLQHHERLDGTGYPLGLTHEKIHPYAKLIAVSDTFHAMTSERYYKNKQSPFKVVEELNKYQFGILDMKIVMALTNSIVQFSNGAKVKLSNNEIGIIKFIDQKHPTRPLIQLENDQLINLTELPNLYIDEVLQ